MKDIIKLWLKRFHPKIRILVQCLGFKRDQKSINFIFKLRRKKPEEVIGLDIGEGSIKIAQVRYIEGEPFLVKTKLVEFQPKEKVEEEGSEKGEAETVAKIEKEEKRRLWAEAAVEALKDAFLDLEISPGSKIVSVVSGPRVGVRQMIIPHRTTPALSEKVERLSTRDLKEMIRWEAKGCLPFSVEEANIEFDPRRKIIVEENGDKKLRVCIAATTNEMLASHLSLLREAGITPALITTTSFSLANLIKRYGLIKEDEVVAIIDLGKVNTDITIFKGEDVEFNRSIPLAGDEINSFLSVALTVEGRALKLNFNQAESVKRRWGIPLSEDSAHRIEEGFSIAELLSMIRPAVERLSVEIRRSFDFYERDLKGGKVEKIVLLGGTSELKGLKEFLSGKLGVEIEIGISLSSVRFLPEPEGKEEKANISPIFAIAVGATMADLKGINLLPLVIRKEPERRLKRRLAKATITSVVLLLLLGYKLLQLQLNLHQKEINALKVELANLRPQTESIAKIAELQAQITKKRAAIDQIFSSQPYWQEVLKELSNIVPYYITLTHLSVKERAFNLKGDLFSEGEAKRSALTDFIADLENSIFKNIEILDIEKDSLRKNKVLFEIKCELD